MERSRVFGLDSTGDAGGPRERSALPDATRCNVLKERDLLSAFWVARMNRGNRHGLIRVVRWDAVLRQ